MADERDAALAGFVATQRAELAAVRAQLARQEARLAAQGAALAALRRRPPRRRARTLAVVALALLAALLPLGALATNPFTDLDPAQAAGHNPNIDAIYGAGITTGCAPTAYCPKDYVTREQMASFLARAAGLGGNPPVANARSAISATTASSADRATLADTATNANQLGGLPSDGYVKAPQLQGIQLFNNQPGPLPLTSGTFSAPLGGTLLVIVSGSGRRTATVGTVGILVGIGIVDAVGYGYEVKTTTNEIDSHKPFAGNFLVEARATNGIPPGSSFYVTIAALPGTVTDLNDFFSVTVLLLPFGG